MSKSNPAATVSAPAPMAEAHDEVDYRFPASKKVYVEGTLFPDVRVPFREIALSPTRGHNGAAPTPNAVAERTGAASASTSGPCAAREAARSARTSARSRPVTPHRSAPSARTSTSA